MDLRERMNEKILRVVGVHDAVTAQLAKQYQFDGVWIGGFGLSTVYGVPDANILTMTEILHVTSVVAASVDDIPIIVDCDSGFGGIHNVARMVKEFERVGAHAVCIEDKPFPKMNSFAPVDQKLIPSHEFSNMLRAAKDSQKKSSFMVIARTEALIAGLGMEEALHRAYLYEEAGADAILVHSKQKTPDQVLEFARKWNGHRPLIIVPTTYPSITMEEIKQTKKIKMVIYANQLLRAYIKSVSNILSHLNRSENTEEIEEDLVSVHDVLKLQGFFDMIEWEAKYKNASTAILRINQ